MNLDKLNQWLSLVANLGLIGGFVLIALQLQQNTQALEVQAQAVRASANIAAESGIMGENAAEAYTTAVLRPHELTETQVMETWGYLSTLMFTSTQAWMNFEAGLMTREEWEFTVQGATYMVDFPFGRIWWESVSFYYPEGFVAEVNRGLEQYGKQNRIVTETRRIIERTRALAPGTTGD